MPNLYYAMFDINGKCNSVFNYTNYQKKALFKIIANVKHIPIYHEFFLNAKRTKQNMWMFESDLNESELLDVSKLQPTEFYQLVQEHGTLVYKSNN